MRSSSAVVGAESTANTANTVRRYRSQADEADPAEVTGLFERKGRCLFSLETLVGYRDHHVCTVATAICDSFKTTQFTEERESERERERERGEGEKKSQREREEKREIER